METVSAAADATIAVCAAAPQWSTHAQRIADQLHLALLESCPSHPTVETKNNYDFLLCVQSYHNDDFCFELFDRRNLKSKLLIDFTTPQFSYRAQRSSKRSEAIARAVGIKDGSALKIIDATAGIGRDAFVLAKLGCQVTMIERSPIMALLLKDAIRRVTQKPVNTPWLIDKLFLYSGDARKLIPSMCATSKVDVIYLDPMYPQRNKSALVKKEMRFLQMLVGKDQDATELLSVALQYAAKRVVVKRPRNAPPLQGATPSHTIESKNTRFDIYITAIR